MITVSDLQSMSNVQLMDLTFQLRDLRRIESKAAMYGENDRKRRIAVGVAAITITLILLFTAFKKYSALAKIGIFSVSVLALWYVGHIAISHSGLFTLTNEQERMALEDADRPFGDVGLLSNDDMRRLLLDSPFVQQG